MFRYLILVTLFFILFFTVSWVYGHFIAESETDVSFTYTKVSDGDFWDITINFDGRTETTSKRKDSGISGFPVYGDESQYTVNVDGNGDVFAVRKYLPKDHRHADDGSVLGENDNQATAPPSTPIRAPGSSPDASSDPTPVNTAPENITLRTRNLSRCPVGWVRSDDFGGRNRRVLLYEVNVEIDLKNPVSIYKPDWVAIYVHPDEALENLDGWKLQVALLYNHHSEYLLTAENSVIVDAGFVEGGFAFIENPEEHPFPMAGIGFTRSPAPGFDYRLYDETGKRVDFGISCYKRGDIFQVLKEMENPRVLRQVLLESFDWDSHFLRSEWTVPVPVNAPGAPSLQRANLVGTWADLKKQ